MNTEVFFLSYPGVRSGGIGSALVNPSLPTNQNVSSTPLPCKRMTGAHMRLQDIYEAFSTILYNLYNRVCSLGYNVCSQLS